MCMSSQTSLVRVHSNYQIGPNLTKSEIPSSTKSGQYCKVQCCGPSYTSALDQSNRTTSDQIADTHYQIGTIF